MEVKKIYSKYIFIRFHYWMILFLLWDIKLQSLNEKGQSISCFGRVKNRISPEFIVIVIKIKIS